MAWVVGTDWQQRGIASEASMAVAKWLLSEGVSELSAHIHPDHLASMRVAEAVGLRPASEVDVDGEVIWRSAGSDR